MFGLTKEQFNFIINHIVTPIENYGGKVYCFGSRARGDNQKYSDLDLMIECEKNLQSEIGQLKEFLSKSNFPLKVDLIQFSDFADSYQPGYQKEKIRFKT